MSTPYSIADSVRKAQQLARYLVQAPLGSDPEQERKRQEQEAQLAADAAEQEQLQSQYDRLTRVVEDAQKHEQFLRPSLGERTAESLAGGARGLERMVTGAEGGLEELGQTLADPQQAATEVAAGGGITPDPDQGTSMGAVGQATQWMLDQYAEKKGYHDLGQVGGEEWRAAHGELDRRRRQGETDLDVVEVLRERQVGGKRITAPEEHEGPLGAIFGGVGRVLATPLEPAREIIDSGKAGLGALDQIVAGARGLGKALTQDVLVEAPRIIGGAIEGAGYVAPGNVAHRTTGLPGGWIGRGAEALGKGIRQAGEDAAAFYGGDAGLLPSQQETPGPGIARAFLPDEPHAAAMLGIGLELAADPFVVGWAAGRAGRAVGDVAKRGAEASRLFERIGKPAMRDKAFQARVGREAREAARAAGARVPVEDIQALVTLNPELAAAERLIRPVDAGKLAAQTDRGERFSARVAAMTPDQRAAFGKDPGGARFLEDLEFAELQRAAAAAETDPTKRIGGLANAERARLGAEKRLRGTKDMVDRFLADAAAKGAGQEEVERLRKYLKLTEEEGGAVLDEAKTRAAASLAAGNQERAAAKRTAAFRAGQVGVEVPPGGVDAWGYPRGGAAAADEAAPPLTKRARKAAEREERLAAKRARKGRKGAATPAASQEALPIVPAPDTPEKAALRSFLERKRAGNEPPPPTVLPSTAAGYPEVPAGASPGAVADAPPGVTMPPLEEQAATPAIAARRRKPAPRDPDVAHHEDALDEIVAQAKTAQAEGDTRAVEQLVEQARETARDLEGARSRADIAGAAPGQDVAPPNIRARREVRQGEYVDVSLEDQAGQWASYARRLKDQDLAAAKATGDRARAVKIEEAYQAAIGKARELETEAGNARLARRATPVSDPAAHQVGEGATAPFSAEADVARAARAAGTEIPEATQLPFDVDVAGRHIAKPAEDLEHSTRARMQLSALSQWENLPEEIQDAARGIAHELGHDETLTKYGTFPEARALRRSHEIESDRLMAQSRDYRNAAPALQGDQAAAALRTAYGLEERAFDERELARLFGQLPDPDQVFAAAGDQGALVATRRAVLDEVQERLTRALQENDGVKGYAKALSRDAKTGAYTDPARAATLEQLAVEHDRALIALRQAGPADVVGAAGDEAFANMLAEVAVRLEKAEGGGKGVRGIFSSERRDVATVLHETTDPIERQRAAAQLELRQARAEDLVQPLEPSNPQERAGLRKAIADARTRFESLRGQDLKAAGRRPRHTSFSSRPHVRPRLRWNTPYRPRPVELGSNPTLLGAWKWRAAGESAAAHTRQFFNSAAAALFERGDPLAAELDNAMARMPSWSELVGLSPNELTPMIESIARGGPMAEVLPAGDRARMVGMLTSGIQPGETMKPYGGQWPLLNMLVDQTHGNIAHTDEGAKTVNALERIQRARNSTVDEILYGTKNATGAKSLQGWRQPGEEGLLDLSYKVPEDQILQVHNLVQGNLDEVRKVLPDLADAAEKNSLAERYPALNAYLVDRNRMYTRAKLELGIESSIDSDSYFHHVVDHETLLEDLRKRAAARTSALNAGGATAEDLAAAKSDEDALEWFRHMQPESHARELFARGTVPKNFHAGFLKERSVDLPGYIADPRIVDPLYFRGVARIKALRDSASMATDFLKLVEEGRRAPVLTFRKRNPLTGTLKEIRRPITDHYANDIKGFFEGYFGLAKENRFDATLRDWHTRVMLKSVTYEKTIGTLKVMSYIGLLGMDPSFFFVNLTQTPINTMALLGGRFTLRGIADVARYHKDLVQYRSAKSALALYKVRGGADAAAIVRREAELADLADKVRPFDDLFRTAGIYSEGPAHEVAFLGKWGTDPRRKSLIELMTAGAGMSETINRQIVAAGTHAKYREAEGWLRAALERGEQPTAFPSRFKSLEGFNDPHTALERVRAAMEAGKTDADAMEAAFEATRNSQFSYSQASGSYAAQRSQAMSLALLYKSFFFKTWASFYPKLDPAQRFKFMMAHLAIGGPAALPVMSWVGEALPQTWIKRDLENLSLNGLDGAAKIAGVPLDEALPDWMFLEEKDPATGAVSKRLPLGLAQVLGWADLPQRLGAGLPLSSSRYSPGMGSSQEAVQLTRALGGVTVSTLLDAGGRIGGAALDAIRSRTATGPLPVQQEYKRRLAQTMGDAVQSWVESQGYDPLLKALPIPGGRNISRFIRFAEEGPSLRTKSGQPLLKKPLTRGEQIREVLGFRTPHLARELLRVQELREGGESQKSMSDTIDSQWFRQLGKDPPSTEAIQELQARYAGSGFKAPNVEQAWGKWLAHNTPIYESMLGQDKERTAGAVDQVATLRANGRNDEANQIEGGMLASTWSNQLTSYVEGDEAAAGRARELAGQIRDWAKRTGINPIAGITNPTKSRYGRELGEVARELEAAYRRTNDWERAGAEAEVAIRGSSAREADKRAMLVFLPILVDTRMARK